MKTEILIIGGGVIGCSLAYHLAQLGKRDVLVVEQYQLTHGATWHAAGLIGQLRASLARTQLIQYSAELYDQLEAATGQAVDWKRVGSLRLASSPERWQEIKDQVSQGQRFGVECYLINAQEAQERFPIIDAGDVVGAAWIPADGYVDPSSLTQAFAKGARQAGVTFREGICVTGLEKVGRHVSQVKTDQGDISTGTKIN